MARSFIRNHLYAAVARTLRFRADPGIDISKVPPPQYADSFLINDGTWLPAKTVSTEYRRLLRRPNETLKITPSAEIVFRITV